MNEQSTQEPVAKAVMGKREVSCHGPNRKYVDGIVIQQLKEIEPDTFLYTHPAPAVAQEPVAFVNQKCAIQATLHGAITLKPGDNLYTEAPTVAHPPADVVRELVGQLQRMVDFVTTGLEVKEDHPYVEMARAALKSAKEHGL